MDQETAPRAASCCCCCCGCWIIGVIDLKHFFLHNNLQHVASIWRWTLFWNKSFFSSANSPIKFKDNPIIFCNQKILLKPTQYLFLFYPALSCFNRWSQNGLPSPTFPFFFANSLSSLPIWHLILVLFDVLGDWGLNIWLAAQLQFGAADVYWAGGISDAVVPFCFWRCSCIHPSKMFQSPLLLKHSQVFSFLYRCLFLFAFLWVSNRKTRISKNTELLCIWYKIKIWASEYYWQCSILQWIYI